MAGWVSRLLGRGGQVRGEDEADRPHVASAMIEAPTVSADRRSIWDEMAADPGAAELRAQWEARWDEF